MASSEADRPLRILGVVGSLRRGSFNRHLMEAVVAAAPATLVIAVHDGLDDIPVFNEDLEAKGDPAGVARLRAAMVAADGLLIATPEYNQSIPGVLKNSIDWLSRGAPDALAGKPTAILGATLGPGGTRLSQAALRQALAACGSIVMPLPQIYVRHAGEAFDTAGKLVDERVRAALPKFLAAFEKWVVMTG